LQKLADDGNTTRITKQALKKLKDYHFPGNVRELENLLERAYTLCESDVIEDTDLDLTLASAAGLSSKSNKSTRHFQACLNHESIDEYLAEIEKEILLDALEHERWNKTNTAKTLGISFRSFRYRLSKLGLDDDE
jgi:two-component system response regulator PilR (NtrC family)